MNNGAEENIDAVYRISSYSGLSGLEEIEREWGQITSQSELVCFYHRYEWYRAYMRNIEPDPDNVCFFLIRENDNPLCIIPIKYITRKYYGIKMNVWVPPLTPEIDLYDFISLEPGIIEKTIPLLIDNLKQDKSRKFDAICLDHIVEDNNASILAKNTFFKTVSFVDRYSKSLVCSNDDEVRDAWGSSKFRRNLRRLEKRLSSKGELSWIYANNYDDSLMAYQEFLDVESSGWKGEKGTGTSIKLRDNFRAFYQELLEEFSSLGLFRINLLQLNGKTIAGQYCLLDKDRINLVKIGFDQEYRNTSPGFLLIKNTFEKLCGPGKCSEMSFVTGAEWNDIFKPVVKNVLAIRIFSNSLKGIYFSLIEQARQSMSKFINDK